VTSGLDWVVLDIEGTLTATSQVHVRLGPWIDEHSDDPAVAEAVERARSLGGLPPTADTAQVVGVLHGWMDADEKVAPLKTLQGLVWQRGYAAGELVTELFGDVAPALRAWRAGGSRLAVFSSGSVAAQVASFSRTTDGDLRGLFDAHFDTVNAGSKRERRAYRAITSALAADPGRVAFLSDVPAELDAAAAVGWRTVGVARRGEPYGDADFGPHRMVSSLAELDVVPV
jgi:enolase-phosphatase E1